MILQALHDLYDRFEKDPEYDVAPVGYSLQKISFVIVLNKDGTLNVIQDHRETEGRLNRPRVHLVPGVSDRTSGVKPQLFWDNTSYLLGFKPDDDNPDRTRKTFEASKQHHLRSESDINHPDYSAICRFFENWNPNRANEHPILNEITTGFGVFQIRGKTNFIHELPEIREWWDRYRQSSSEGTERQQRTCLITGQTAPVANLHEPKIKGVKDAQGAGALIVSFNTNAYESFGKEAGENAPVSVEAATKYCKSLNALLSSRRHRLQIGDATTVFWTQSPTRTESILCSFLGGNEDGTEETESPPSQKRQLLQKLQSTLRSIGKGGKPDSTFAEESGKTFYILGLTGQAGGRIGIRFWYRSNVGHLLENLARHHADLRIQRQWEPGPKVKNPDPEFLAVWQLLRQTGRETKDVPPTLSGALMRSVLTGTNYPQVLVNSVISRIRVDRQINYSRAAILKAWLVRNHKQNIPMTYDPNKPDAAYRLGALFALLEKTQADALGNINAGIRDRFYSSASATPASVFPRLLRTYQHHLSKAGSQNKGYQIHREREVQSVLAEPEPIKQFPSHLNIREQGLFALGYYHKTRDLWTKKDDRKHPEPDTEPAVS